MELKEFVAESLRQIIEGVKAAQAAPDGANVNAASVTPLSGNNIVHAFSSGTFTMVQFDVAVSAEASGKAGGSVKVWGIGGEAGGERKTGNVSRIAFAVPVRLPDGDQSRAEGIHVRNAMATRQSGSWDADDYLNR